MRLPFSFIYWLDLKSEILMMLFKGAAPFLMLKKMQTHELCSVFLCINQVSDCSVKQFQFSSDCSL